MAAPSPISDQAEGDLPDFNDARVQLVYEMLCAPANPPTGEHWEGFIARKIVAALSTAPTTGSAPIANTDEWHAGYTAGYIAAEKDAAPASPAASVIEDIGDELEQALFSLDDLRKAIDAAYPKDDPDQQKRWRAAGIWHQINRHHLNALLNIQDARALLAASMGGQKS